MQGGGLARIPMSRIAVVMRAMLAELHLEIGLWIKLDVGI
jgi:hypothetical protein